jgi:ribosomal protein S18 acetylase RimI-like enzyme
VIDELRGAFDLLATGDMFGTRRADTRYGSLVWTPELPLRHDSNYVLVDALPADVTADLLAKDAEEACAAAGVAHCCAFVRDAPTAERLAADFEARGWEVTWSVVMAHHRRPERPVNTSLATEVPWTTLRPVHEAFIRSYPWGTPDVARQLLDAQLAMPVETRYFAVLLEGEPVSWTNLYIEGGAAQVEAVGTLETHRNRGYASAVVMRAVEEARSAGADLVFLVALADDWPRELYRRLGFDVIGRYAKFLLREDP